MKKIPLLSLVFLVLLSLTLALPASAKHHSGPRVVTSHSEVTLQSGGAIDFTLVGSGFPPVEQLALSEILPGEGCNTTLPASVTTGLEGHFRVHATAPSGCIPGIGHVFVSDEDARPIKTVTATVDVDAP